uniref:Flavin-containing monooxygenase n=1 Tax=Solanum chacoense TaxID=4108 RepID=A0A0V0HJ45_SOLCH
MVLEYIESYARQFDLFTHIHFNSKVLSLNFEDGGSGDGEWNLWSGKGKWNVTVQDTRTISPQIQVITSLNLICVSNISFCKKQNFVFYGRKKNVISNFHLFNNLCQKILSLRKKNY